MESKNDELDLLYQLIKEHAENVANKDRLLKEIFELDC